MAAQDELLTRFERLEIAKRQRKLQLPKPVACTGSD
jgi:hypothetical protein